MRVGVLVPCVRAELLAHTHTQSHTHTQTQKLIWPNCTLMRQPNAAQQSGSWWSKNESDQSHSIYHCQATGKHMLKSWKLIHCLVRYKLRVAGEVNKTIHQFIMIRRKTRAFTEINLLFHQTGIWLEQSKFVMYDHRQKKMFWIVHKLFYVLIQFMHQSIYKFVFFNLCTLGMCLICYFISTKLDSLFLDFLVSQ